MLAAILRLPVPDSLTSFNEDMTIIEKRNKTPIWKLK
jgi:hypothetical protein